MASSNRMGVAANGQWCGSFAVVAARAEEICAATSEPGYLVPSSDLSWSERAN